MNDNQKQLLKDVIFMIILVAFMLFTVKVVPNMMGGVQDANGNPLLISQVAHRQSRPQHDGRRPGRERQPPAHFAGCRHPWRTLTAH